MNEYNCTTIAEANNIALFGNKAKTSRSSAGNDTTTIINIMDQASFKFSHDFVRNWFYSRENLLYYFSEIADKKTNGVHKFLRETKKEYKSSAFLNQLDGNQLTAIDLLELYTKGRYCSCAPFGFMMEVLNLREQLVINDKSNPRIYFQNALAFEFIRSGDFWSMCTEDYLSKPLEYKRKNPNLISFQEGKLFLDYEIVIYPINYNNKHWVLGVIDITNKEVLILNSAVDLAKDRKHALLLLEHTRIHFMIAEQEANFNMNEWSIELSNSQTLKVPQQDETSSDCFIFCLLMAECYQLDINFSHITQRNILANSCNIRKMITKFLLIFDKLKLDNKHGNSYQGNESLYENNTVIPNNDDFSIFTTGEYSFSGELRNNCEESMDCFSTTATNKVLYAPSSSSSSGSSSVSIYGDEASIRTHTSSKQSSKISHISAEYDSNNNGPTSMIGMTVEVEKKTSNANGKLNIY